jgi:hypothetical protein
MTHPMPDQTEQPAKRMTTAEAAALAQKADQNASAALRVAQGSDDMVAVMSEKITDLATRLGDLGATGSTTSGPSHDQVDARVHEALAPLHDEVHELRRAMQNPATSGNLDAILARLEDAERKAAGMEPGAITERVAQELHSPLSELRRRLTAVEEAAKTFDADPVSHTLAEDALADQIEAQVRRLLEPATADLAHVINRAHERLEAVEAEQAMGVPGVGARPAPRLGAARKVLEVMRMVTFIGKEKQADLGTGGKFKFRGIDDAMDAVGHAIREVGLIISPEILKDETTQNAITKAGTGRDGGKYENTVIWTTTKLTVRYTFLDPDDGSTHSIEMVGEGRDASDKSTSKAGSMAFKYGLLQGLCIPVTGLDDSDAAPPQRMEQERAEQRPPAQPQTGQPAAGPSNEQKAQRGRDALQAIRNVYRVPGGAQAQYNRVIQIMNHARNEGLLDLVLEGSTLDQHGRAALATLQAPPPAQEYQPSQAELDAAVRDLPSGQYPPDEGGY